MRICHYIIVTISHCWQNQRHAERTRQDRALSCSLDCCQLVQSHTRVVYLRAAVSDEIMTLFADEADFSEARIVVLDQTTAGPQIQTVVSLPTRFLRCPVGVGHGTRVGAQFPIQIGRLDASTGRPQIRPVSYSPTRVRRPHTFCKQTIQEHEA